MTPTQEFQMYRNFDELATDVLDLAKEILPNKLIYLSSLTDVQQVVLKVSDEHSEILVSEGAVVPLPKSVCNRIDFSKNEPLIYEDVERDADSVTVKRLLKGANIHSYMGLPITHMNGERFGTLCVADSKASEYDEKSIELLQRIVKMFSYYLELERCAYRDPLTDLYNRRYLSKRFEDTAKQGGSLFYLDLDGFKKVNDTFGHDAGDEVLKEVAKRLMEATRNNKESCAVRLGGDEFIVHFAYPTTEEEVSHCATKLVKAMEKWEEGYRISASIGVVLFEADEEIDLDAVLKKADHALYTAKLSGKNTFFIYKDF
ncbi:sensor domain-containing diguanylate cyclase [Chryseomicrobium palamuruense]